MKNLQIVENSNEQKLHNYSNNKVLEFLKTNMYLGIKGEINYRLSSNDAFIPTKDFKGLECVLSNFSGYNIDLSSFYNKKNKEDNEEKLKISPEDLKLVTEDIFDPFSKEEFILKNNGTYLLNKFKPSYYMQLDSNKMDLRYFDIEKTTIFLLILNLVNNNKHRAYWVINWLAYFFQGLKKSQVALVLVGIEGTGKGVLFENVIKPLIGESYTKTINDKSIDTKYKGGLVENVLFFHLDEISSQRAANDSIRNFLKALITNPTITAEKKNKTLEKETSLHGQVLFSTNEYDAIEIGVNDRRYTVFSTGDKLANINFLGCGNYDNLAFEIKKELEIVAIYLKNYPVDKQMADTALSTPEKDEMIRQYALKQQVKVVKQQKVLQQPKLTNLQTKVLAFVNALICRNYNVFNSIIDADKMELKNEILADLQQGIFRIENLLPAFKTLYGGRSFGTNSEFLRELQMANNLLFSNQNIRQFQIGDEIKHFMILPFL